jgi:hypothetical protein
MKDKMLKLHIVWLPAAVGQRHGTSAALDAVCGRHGRGEEPAEAES